MKYTIKSFIASDGERFSQLYEAEAPGFPLFYPTAFITRHIRSNSTHETQKAYLSAIRLVCEWESKNNIDLALSFHKRKFLSAAQIDDLANHLRSKKSKAKGSVISSAKFNIYLAYAEKYIRWLAQEVITEKNSTNVKLAINEQSEALKGKKRRKAGSKSANQRRILAENLNEGARRQLLELFVAPFQLTQNPQDHGARLRNIVMLRVLYDTGMRSGELLGLKLINFIEASGGDSAYLDIERNHHDKFDTRTNQPVAKTLGRRLPITEELEAQIKEYRDNWRAEINGVDFSGENFLFVVHRGGRNQGRALTKSALDCGLAHLKNIFPALKSVHPHLLRHDWNYRFSETAEAMNLSDEEERTHREQLMGWITGSNMSKIYNQRHIQEKSHEIGLKVASDTARPKR
ncbi:tyrosine-type recombinase/integrase [Pseudomonas aeruginosa]